MDLFGFKYFPNPLSSYLVLAFTFVSSHDATTSLDFIETRRFTSQNSICKYKKAFHLTYSPWAKISGWVFEKSASYPKQSIFRRNRAFLAPLRFEPIPVQMRWLIIDGHSNLQPPRFAPWIFPANQSKNLWSYSKGFHLLSR